MLLLYKGLQCKITMILEVVKQPKYNIIRTNINIVLTLMYLQ